MQMSDISTLSPAAVVTEIELIKQTMAREAVYGNTLSALGRQPDFRPVDIGYKRQFDFQMTVICKRDFASTYAEALNASLTTRAKRACSSSVNQEKWLSRLVFDNMPLF
jgi:hypothetical protein